MSSTFLISHYSNSLTQFQSNLRFLDMPNFFSIKDLNILPTPLESRFSAVFPSLNPVQS